MYELLIVDDEEISRNSLAMYFPWEKEGFHVCGQVENGVEAISFIENHTVHVVLTDISMPVMNGVELAQELHGRSDSPCVVFLTAYKDFEYARSAIQYGVRFYILKPSDFTEIRETFEKIREELDRRFHVQNTLSENMPEDEIIAHVMEYIQGQYQNATLQELSKRLYINPSYLSQLIKLKTGQNFSDLLYETRMQQACLLLKNPEIKVYDVSVRVGYTNPNNFTRAFKNRFQMSPKEYQLNCKKEHL